jgi:hypothetical protein
MIAMTLTLAAAVAYLALRWHALAAGLPRNNDDMIFF